MYGQNHNVPLLARRFKIEVHPLKPVDNFIYANKILARTSTVTLYHDTHLDTGNITKS
jgi:hypothetical protein